MSGNAKVIASDHDAARGSKRSYVTGFLLSVVFTLIAFALVKVHVDSGHDYLSDDLLMIALPALAVMQLFIQLVFFLHVGRESKPRWNSWALSFAITVVVILVIGSLWIMSNLNYRMMSSPTEIQRYLDSQSDL